MVLVVAMSTPYEALAFSRIAQVSDGKVIYMHEDHLGSINVVTDHNGHVRQILEYQPYGKTSRSQTFEVDGQAVDVFQQFTGQYNDVESQLYFYNARYYDPQLARFITPDEIVQKAGWPITLNRYAYVGNNPVVRTDPSGHIFGFVFSAFKALFSLAIAHPVLASGAVGAVSGGITAHHNDANVFKGIALGAVQGGVSGYTLGLPSRTPGVGAGLSLLKASAAVSLTSQAVDAIGESNLAQGLRYGSTILSGAYASLNIGMGIREWSSGQLTVMDLTGQSTTLQSGDGIYVNGILTDSNRALEQANQFRSLGYSIQKVAHNPTHGFIADMTEAFLQKLTFTSSVDRQLAGLVNHLNRISLSGHSQGSLIVSNSLLSLGMRQSVGTIADVAYLSTPLSQPRAFISARIGQVAGDILYANNWGDPINLVGPNLNPIQFMSGFTFQIQNH